MAFEFNERQSGVLEKVPKFTSTLKEVSVMTRLYRIFFDVCMYLFRVGLPSESIDPDLPGGLFTFKKF